jgi:transposase
MNRSLKPLRNPTSAWNFSIALCYSSVPLSPTGQQKCELLARGTRYIWLRNPANLTARQRQTLGSLPARHLRTVRAYQMRLAFQEFYDQPTTEAATPYLRKPFFWTTYSRL